MAKIKKFLILFLFFFIVSCSLGDKTGIWTGDKNEEKQASEIEEDQKKNNKIFKVYTTLDTYKFEKFTSYKVKLSKPKKNLFWKSSNFNAQNFIGHNYLNGIENVFLKKKLVKISFIRFKPHHLL